MRPFALAGAILLASLVSSCVIDVSPTLYPLNHTAYAGIVKVTMLNYEQRFGAMDIEATDGENFHGTYQIFYRPVLDFGDLLRLGGGPRRCTTPSGQPTTEYTYCGKGEGAATLNGTRGTFVECEFLDDYPPFAQYTQEGHGLGTCRFSTGNLYRMIY